MNSKEPTKRAQSGDDQELDLTQELVGEPDTIAYIRVSGEAARLELDAYRAKLVDYAREEGWTPAFLEDCGSSVRPRPGFDAFIEAIRGGHVKHVMVAAGHHLARNIEQSIEIQSLLRASGGELINVSLPRGYRSGPWMVLVDHSDGPR